MGLYYITGVSGSGKSEVRLKLRELGYEAYGTDEDGIAFFYNNETGETVDNPIDAPPRSLEWRNAHTWKASREKFEELALEAKDRTIFICGGVNNDDEVWDLFSGVAALVIGTETLIFRIKERTGNNFGKSDHELNDILKWQETAEDIYRKLGVHIIDGEQDIDKVIGDIIKAFGLEPLTINGF